MNQNTPMQQTTTIGIDPGVSGGICVRYHDGMVYATRMPETQGDILNELHAIHRMNPESHHICYIEKIPTFMGTEIPQSKIAVMFENYGFIKGVVQGMKIPLYEIRPQVWMQSLGIGGVSRQRAPKGATIEQKRELARLNEQAKRDWKRKLKAEAQRRYPTLDITLDKADAILLMDYGLRQQGHNVPVLPPAQPALV